MIREKKKNEHSGDNEEANISYCKAFDSSFDGWQ
jgi:hypothetical protein